MPHNPRNCTSYKQDTQLYSFPTNKTVSSKEPQYNHQKQEMSNDSLPFNLQTSVKFPNCPRNALFPPNNALTSRRVLSRIMKNLLFCLSSPLSLEQSSIFFSFYYLSPSLQSYWPPCHRALVLAAVWNDPLFYVYPHDKILHFYKSLLKNPLFSEAFLDLVWNLYTPSWHFVSPFSAFPR